MIGMMARGRREFITGTVVLLAILAFTAPGCRIRVGEGDPAWNDFVGPYRHEAEVNGVRMHYIDMGQGDPVLLIHGYADSTYGWHRNLRPLLDAGYRVVLVDQPGLGRSGVPPEPYLFSVENQAGVILTLADRLGLRKFSAVGHSMGGGISLYLSHEHPDRVRCVVAIDPACYQPPGHGLTQLLTLPGVPTLADATKGRFLVERSLKDVYFNDDLVDDALIDEYARPMNRKGYMNVLGALRKEFFSEEFARMTEDYGSLAPPLLILWGERDTWVPPAFGTRLQATVPGSRLRTVPESGHNPHQERPDVVNALLLDFLASECGDEPAPTAPSE
jgi:pimeloyl-ACP methyl ester carboxylesterase